MDFEVRKRENDFVVAHPAGGCAPPIQTLAMTGAANLLDQWDGIIDRSGKAEAVVAIAQTSEAQAKARPREAEGRLLRLHEMLNAYQLGGPFPTYGDLRALTDGMESRWPS